LRVCDIASRKEWLLKQFEEAGKKSSNVNQYQLWRHDNKPIELWSNKVIDEKLNYIHNNPVEEGLVFRAEHLCIVALLIMPEKKDYWILC